MVIVFNLNITWKNILKPEKIHLLDLILYFLIIYLVFSLINARVKLRFLMSHEQKKKEKKNYCIGLYHIPCYFNGFKLINPTNFAKHSINVMHTAYNASMRFKTMLT
jgi:hypothetical protein